MTILTPPPRRVLYLFAHQDDEFFIVPDIRRELAGGSEVFCMFLTDGTGRGSSSAVRDCESLRYLAKIGVEGNRVFFLGSMAGIPDTMLPEWMDSAYDEIKKAVGDLNFSKLVCTGWEGGNQDHDAVYLLGLALAHEWNIIPDSWQFYLYNGFNTWGLFFRVMTPVPDATGSQRLTWSTGRGLAWLLSCFSYRSQLRTWIGLFPQIFLKLVIEKELSLKPIAIGQVGDAPHPGTLLYERWDRMTLQHFDSATKSFRERRLRR